MFVDTGAWYALLDRDDTNHHAAVKFKDSVHPLVTSNYIADVVTTLTRNRLGHKIAVGIGQKMWSESIANLCYMALQDEKRAGGGHL